MTISNENLLVAPLVVATKSLDAYLHSVSQIPILTEKQERELFRRFKESHDLEAAKQLAMHHLRFVVHIAKGYAGYGLPLADLVQEGTIGLMKAIQKFELKHKVRLITFAVYWIKSEIHNFILRNWRIVKIATTKAQRRLFFNLRKATKKLNWFSQEEAKEVASELKVSPEQVVTMERRLSSSDVSLDATSNDEHPYNYLPANHDEEPVNYLIKQESGEKNLEYLKIGLANLDARSRDIIQQRWLDSEKSTLQALANKYQISAERVRQIELAAFKQLAKYLNN